MGCAVGRFKPFVWPVVLRSVRTEAVSINGMPIYIEITRNRTSILWKQLPGVVSRNAKINATTPAAQGYWLKYSDLRLSGYTFRFSRPLTSSMFVIGGSVGASFKAQPPAALVKRSRTTFRYVLPHRPASSGTQSSCSLRLQSFQPRAVYSAFQISVNRLHSPISSRTQPNEYMS